MTPGASIVIRPYQPGEEAALYALFHASVHGLASQFYTPAQVQAWAPKAYDHVRWTQRLHANRPFVALLDEEVAGFADVQPSGYIDQFFVSPRYARQGVGSALLGHLMRTAQAAGTPVLSSNVSLAAQGLFRRFGFTVIRCNVVECRGALLDNATMELDLPGARAG